MPVKVGRTLQIGRSGELELGVTVVSKGISRRAAEVRATEVGWEVDIRNHNGAVLHLWGQVPHLVAGLQRVSWPRAAIRFLSENQVGGKVDASGPAHHWLLLEAEIPATYPAPTRGGRRTTGRTITAKPPPPLSRPQEEALRLVFHELLRWPPRVPAQPMQLDAAARRLGISENAIRERLLHAHGRALRLGLPRRVGLTNPEYLYVLVQAGYLVPPPRRPAYRFTPSWLH
ncbi:helix-turn-helix domain-containing protein [Frankia sp. AgKG'84/4]|uniref:hypothetical protein n=1 Tax=Frankia sp. AgKG'84/4 TaxID=573490 RepID=UPI00200F7EDE|nr:hypothetical protein [Frankia sp. AgKG'84/4]MCL9793479.1 hypothetical protein [Frankia sp. AgKG'84/4]